MELVLLERRLTRRYNDDWACLDNWKYEGFATLTPGRMVAEGNGFDEGGTYIRWATIKRSHPSWGHGDREAIVRALEDTLSRRGCSCEHDCCGCPSWHTRVLHRRGRRLVLRTRISFNY